VTVKTTTDTANSHVRSNPAAREPGAAGVIAALAAAGAGLGVVIAGPIVSALDYHWLFWLPLILTVITAVCAIALVPESEVRKPGRISWQPAILPALIPSTTGPPGPGGLVTDLVAVGPYILRRSRALPSGGRPQ